MSIIIHAYILCIVRFNHITITISYLIVCKYVFCINTHLLLMLFETRINLCKENSTKYHLTLLSFRGENILKFETLNDVYRLNIFRIIGFSMTFELYFHTYLV